MSIVINGKNHYIPAADAATGRPTVSTDPNWPPPDGTPHIKAPDHVDQTGSGSITATQLQELKNG